MELEQILRMQPIPKQLQIIEWKQDPYSMMDKIEVLKGVRVKNKEGYQSSLFAYKNIREKVKKGKVIIVGAISLSGAGKGTLLASIYRLLKNDIYLSSRLEAEETKLNLMPVQYSTYSKASHTEKVCLQYPQFYVPPEFSGALLQPEHYEKISGLTSAEIDRFVISDIPTDEARVLLLESSSLTSIPKSSNLPLELLGEADRGNSPLYKLALSGEIKNDVDIFAIEREEEVCKISMKWRQEFSENNEDLIRGFRGNVRFIFTNSEGDEVDAAYIPIEVQKGLASFIAGITAPPKARARSDADFDWLVQKIYEEGKICGGSYRSVFNHLKQILSMNDASFHITSPGDLLASTHYDLDYFFDSLAVRCYPEILPPTLLSYIRSRGRIG